MRGLTDELKEYALNLGADLAGIADLKRIEGIKTIPENLLSPFTKAIVIAFQMSPEIFEQMKDEPTPLYANQYAAVNRLLDSINLRLQSKILKMGYKALAIPAAQTLDREKWLGHISAKAVAQAAGLGWQGKSSLLVTPQYGPRVRIACLLTDAPLVPDDVLSNKCGNCTECKDSCPAGAVYGISCSANYTRREQAIDLQKCVEYLGAIARKQKWDSYICGVCIKACPWGKQRNLANN